jgi:hypothetical protein
MKKKLSIYFLFFIILSFVSCKKDWVCTCDVNGLTPIIEITDEDEDDAKKRCDITSETYKKNGGEGCTLTKTK